MVESTVLSRAPRRTPSGDGTKKDLQLADDVKKGKRKLQSMMMPWMSSPKASMLFPVFSGVILLASFLFLHSPTHEKIAIMIKAENEHPLVKGAVYKRGGMQLQLYRDYNCQGDMLYNVKSKDHAKMFTAKRNHTHPVPLSARVIGTNGYVDVLSDNSVVYNGAIMAVEDCVNLQREWFLGDWGRNATRLHFWFRSEKPTSPKATPQIPPELQQQFSTHKGKPTKPHTRFVFSVTSSSYFGYQVFANAAAFLQSRQTDSSWTRLLSSRLTDDLSERFPTFTAPKSLYVQEYLPINKPDIIDKWMHSADAPNPEDTVVVIDPDNWLLKDLKNWTKQISKGQAMGQFSYYFGDNRIETMWKELCWENCDNPIDMVGVPYIVKASDLRLIAPLWRNYTIVIHQKISNDPAFQRKYAGLGLEWASEMVGYNMASAHCGIRHTVDKDLQVRDTQTTFNHKEWEHVPMLHAGRAWFPKEHAKEAARWKNEDDGGFDLNGQAIQVWCKCNATGHKIHPWPLPQGLDFVSSHTLRILHDSKEMFGQVPVTYNRTRQDYKPDVSSP